MPAVVTNLIIEQGADWAYGWSVTYNGTPLDATWTARGQIRKSVVAAEVLHELAADVDTEGNVTIAVGAAESSAWNWRAGVYDVEVVNADGSATLRVAKGSVSVDPEVTR